MSIALPEWTSAAVRLPAADRLAGIRTEPAALPTGTRPPLWWLLGARGGVGVSTLSQLWAPAGDSGRSWPGCPTESPYTVLVCRSTVESMAAAADLARQYHCGGVGFPRRIYLVGAVVVAARPGRGLSKTVRRYRDHQLAEMVGEVWNVNWHAELLEDVEIADLPSWTPGEPRTKRVRAVTSTEVATDIARIGQSIAATVAEHARQVTADPAARRPDLPPSGGRISSTALLEGASA